MAKISDVQYKWWLRDLLEFGILIALVVFISVIYIPRSIWQEEEIIRDQSRFRMENVYDVLSFYQLLTSQPTDDVLWALKVVNTSRDSIMADSTFIGPQMINLPGGKVTVDLYEGYPVAFDTAFGFFQTRKDTLIDTILTVVSFNEEESANDTSFVRVEQINPYLTDSSFLGIADTTISSHAEVISFYETYEPDSSMFFCPLTNLPYRVEMSEDMIIVESPIEEKYIDQRYIIFSFQALSHGRIENGEKSWVRF